RHHRAIPGEVLQQRAAHRLDHISLDLVLQPVRVDDLPAVVHHIETRHADLTAPAVDLDLGHRADIGADEFVFDIGEPAPLRDVAGPPILLPPCPLLPFPHTPNPLP